MSGFDPLAALGAEAALQQSSLAAIDLGVAIEILQSQLTVGDLLTATILPPQGGSDLLSFLGQTVAAQLPPGIDPGQSLLLQVTGFTSSQILVRNLGVVDPANPPPTAQVALPPPAAGAPVTGTLTTVVPPQPAAGPAAAPASAPSAPAAPPAPSAGVPPGTATAARAPAAAAPLAPPPAATGTVAPPRSVFVAASVQPAPPPSEGAPVEAAAVPLAAQAELGVEARIVATRAAAIDLAELVNTPGKPPGAQAAPALPPPAAPAAAATPAPAPGAAVESPPSAPVVSAAAVAPPARGIAPRAGAPPASPAPPSTVRPAPPATPEAALLARLRVPASAATLAAARVAANAASALPRALARLDAALARVASDDPRAGSLRALVAFVTKLEAANPRALPEQIMAFVSNVLEGAEGKLAAIVRQFAGLQAEAEAAAADGAAPADPGAAEGDPALPALPGAPVPAAPEASSAAPGTAPPAAAANPPSGSPPATAASPAAPASAPAAPAAAPAAPSWVGALPPTAAAHVAERLTALQYDLKAAIVALAQSPPRGAPPDLAPALDSALTAITAMQLNALSAQSTDPNAIVIPLPMFFHEGGRPVQLRVSRDAPRGGKLDGDNFHIAFVLDTKSLGTVAVDVQTVGRAVSVNVKTEAAPAANRFRATLDDLRGRLEHLRYRVSNMAAGVAPHRFGAAAETGAPSPSPERGAQNVDARA